MGEELTEIARDIRRGPRALSADQCRAARALLGWTQARVAGEAGLTRMSVVLFESGTQSIRLRSRLKLMDAFQRHGVEFLWAGDAGEGVRLQRAAADGGAAADTGNGGRGLRPHQHYFSPRS